MLCKLAWQFQTNSSLNVAAIETKKLLATTKYLTKHVRPCFLEINQDLCLLSNTTQSELDVVVHDYHGLVGYASIRMNLLQDFVDVRVEAILILSSSSSLDHLYLR